jgi:hypothetical protein
MSFGTFASKAYSDMEIPLDLSVEHDFPDGFAANTQSFMDVDSSPTITSSITPPPNMPSQPPDIPWSVVAPVAIIGVALAAVAWFMFKDKPLEIPI